MHYKIVYTDIKYKPQIDHLPITYKARFRVFARAVECARKLHKQGRDVLIAKLDDSEFYDSWMAFHNQPFELDTKQG